MGWELRNGKRYYYRKLRRGRRVVSEYVGTGEFIELSLGIIEFDRVEKIQARTAWREQKEEMKKLNEDFNQLAEVINSMVRASLLVAGYHPHKGQWRRNRYG